MVLFILWLAVCLGVVNNQLGIFGIKEVPVDASSSVFKQVVEHRNQNQRQHCSKEQSDNYGNSHRRPPCRLFTAPVEIFSQVGKEFQRIAGKHDEVEVEADSQRNQAQSGSNCG